jgi:hypothetical protein
MTEGPLMGGAARKGLLHSVNLLQRNYTLRVNELHGFYKFFNENKHLSPG